MPRRIQGIKRIQVSKKSKISIHLPQIHAHNFCFSEGINATLFESDEDFVEYLHLCRCEGMQWIEIANDLNCSISWLHKWKAAHSYVDIEKGVDNYPGKLLRAMELGDFHPTELPNEMWKLLDFYRELSLSWEDVARNESISIKWLRAWRKKYNYVDEFNDIDDAQLDEVVSSIIRDHPLRGEVMTMSCLRVEGIRVTRQRLRDSMDRVDPIGRESRRHKSVKRRVHSVPGPHHLWHIDGYHKLRAYHLVIHAGIDGFTRLCTFVRCNDNNAATTVVDDFLSGVRRFGCPSRVRTDKGGENVEIGIFMCMERGLDRGSIIMGRSVHNQRIERFWCDLKKEVILFYITVFTFLEREHGVDFSQEAHIFCVHYLFIARINADLALFQDRWNNHGLSSERNRTPLQLEFLNQHLSAASSESLPIEIDDYDNYGIENEDMENEFYQLQDETNARPRISSVANPLTPLGFQVFSTLVRPLTLEDDDCSLYIDHVVYALQQFDIARLL